MNDDAVADEPQHDAERRTRAVALITAATMVAEIGAGWWFNSMALLADGWHMGTHAAAIGLAALAYALVRRWRGDERFAFGPWKVEILAAFASAVALLAAAVGIASASVERLIAPRAIQYEEAMVVAMVGLLVNLLCAWLLGGHGSHVHAGTHPPAPVRAGGAGALARGDGAMQHGAGRDAHHQSTRHHHPDLHHPELDHQDPGPAPGHAPHHHGLGHDDPGRDPRPDDHPHRARHQHAHPDHHPDAAHANAPHADLNLRSAYLHVLADAATSALAIVALAGGLWLGLDGLDPVVGLVGALLVGRWGVLLMRDTGRVLLDREMDDPLPRAVRRALDDDAPWAGRADVGSLRMWRIGRNDWACTLRLTSRDPALSAARVRGWLARWPQLRQATIEIDCR